MHSEDELRAELEATRAELEVVRAQSDTTVAQTQRAYSSPAWRLAAPVRTVGRTLRRSAVVLLRTFRRKWRRLSPRDYPDAYGLVDHIATSLGCRRIVLLGRERAGRIEARHSAGSDSVVICPRLDAAANPEDLLKTLRDLLYEAPYAVVTALDRMCAPGTPRGRHSGVARWSLDEFTGLLNSAGLEVMFSGFTTSNGRHRQKDALIAVVCSARAPVAAPPQFRVLALIYAYNEEDVIASTIEHLAGQGVELHLVDNWSTDGTAQVAERYLGRGLRAITRFPEEGPSPTFDLHALLQHVEHLAAKTDADWIVRQDADEMRESPWPGVDLRQALYQVDQEGFNAVDHTVLDFPPTGAGPAVETRVQDRLKRFEFGARPGHFVQIKAWKRQVLPVDLASSGGHQVRFPDRRVYPFKFLLRHYPIRSQEHGERKVVLERQQRVDRFARDVRGWHTHYEKMAKQSSFVRNPGDLLLFDGDTFYTEYVVERLSGVGIVP